MVHIRHIRFDWQIVPFLLSAIAGLVIAFDTTAALIQFALILIGLALYLFFANKTEPAPGSGGRSGLRMTLALIPPILTLCFLFANDWSHWIGKIPILSSLIPGALMNLALSKVLQLNSNVTGSSIAAFLPLQIEALRGSRSVLKALLIGLSLLGLMLSAARGAWIALVLATGMWLVWKIVNRQMSSQRSARIAWGGIIVLAGVVLAAVLVTTPLGGLLLAQSGQRPDIWRNSVALIGDYPFTGSGLGSFEMVYSTYALLVHVGHTLHAHNLWLDLWLNLGPLGVVAFAGLVLNAIWPRPDASHWRMAALVSLAVILMHGLVDDAFYGYGGAAIPLLLVPLALLIRPAEQAASAALQPGTAAGKAASRIQPTLAVWGTAIAVLIFSLITPNGRAAAEANMGAVLQTRAELSVYHWPQYGLQDVVRQTGIADLKAANGYYQDALEIDPDQVTANRRLGQIQLAMGQFQSACLYLVRAYSVAPQQRATNQLLGECYALRGEIDQAVRLWRTIDMSEGQLIARKWWYGTYLATPSLAARLNRAALALGGN